MVTVLKNVLSFILPVTVLILVPRWIEPDLSLKSVATTLAGLLLILSGLYGLIRTIVFFNTIGKGTLAPWSPTRHLVVTGLHAYVRNPMILGVLTILIGESILWLSWRIFLWAIVFFLINTIYFVIYEEPDLERKFGEEYKEYKRKVRRWIPNKTPYHPENK